MTSAIHPMVTLDYSLMRPTFQGLPTSSEEEILQPALHKMSTTNQGGVSSTPPDAAQVVVEKPPLPPKPATLAESTQLSDSKAESPISSSSRSCFHPEGSIDLSPSCSESLPTTPAYLKWAENMQFLLDDGDGCELFKEYLDQQSLGHLLEFVLAVKGFKITVGGGQGQADEDLKLRLIKTINKRYINSLGKNLSSKIECLTVDQRKHLDEKILSKTGLDLNIFDGLNASVLEHLESKCYPNFLTSEIYIQHVQSFADVNVQVSGDKYLSSTASSSICGPPGLQKGADDSGISGITTSEKTTGGHPGVSAVISPPVSTAAEPSTASTSCNVSQLLPTVNEDSEMNFSSKGFGARPKTSSTSLMSKSMSALTTESHPTSMMMSSASFPYHAHSSNWNPVSRQDSELQSQSSGAGGIFAGGVAGDTTDTDNYSTYRIEPPASSSIRPRQVSKNRTKAVKPEVKNKENAQSFIPRPFITSEPYTLATNNPDKFAKDLCQRLNQVLANQSADSKLKGILDLNKSKSSTYADSYDLESDQSILDEHVDRVFNADERSRHNVSSMMDTSRMSNYQSATGYRTLDNSRQHHSFYGKIEVLITFFLVI